jgi:hypothetical protein
LMKVKSWCLQALFFPASGQSHDTVLPTTTVYTFPVLPSTYQDRSSEMRVSMTVVRILRRGTNTSGY